MLLISTPVSAKPEIRGAIFLASFMHAVRFPHGQKFALNEPSLTIPLSSLRRGQWADIVEKLRN
jgi:hypothetical protein